jgi:hypothetical protein
MRSHGSVGRNDLRVEIVDAFVHAARCVDDVLASPFVAERWSEPSALPEMTVGSLAGHVFLVLRRLDKQLDEAVEPDPRHPTVPFPWLRVEERADLDGDMHQRVRADGDHVARWGWEAVRDACAQRTEKLAGRLADRRARLVPLPGGVIDLEEYLETRVVELLVHGDDLAASVGSPFEPPADATALAVETVVRAARAWHGDLAVLRTFTRRERVRGPGPTVF